MLDDILFKTSSFITVAEIKKNGDIFVRGKFIINDLNLHNCISDKLDKAVFTPTIKGSLSSGITLIDENDKEIIRLEDSVNYINGTQATDEAVYSALNVWCGVAQ